MHSFYTQARPRAQLLLVSLLIMLTLYLHLFTIKIKATCFVLFCFLPFEYYLHFCVHYLLLYFCNLAQTHLARPEGGMPCLSLGGNLGGGTLWVTRISKSTLIAHSWATVCSCEQLLMHMPCSNC